MSAARRPGRLPAPIRWLAGNVAIALIYAVAGVLADTLTLPTGHASPLFAPAGIAAATILLRGPGLLPGVFVGCLLFLDWVGAEAAYGAGAIAAPAAMAAGATLQALFAATLVRRFGNFPRTADSAAPLMRRVLLAGPLASVVSPTTGVVTLYLVGALGAGDIAFNWLTWWIGDTFGTALLGPITAVMLSRRSTEKIRPLAAFALPMLSTVLFLGLAIAEIGRRDREALIEGFEREALFTSNSVFGRFDSLLLSLEAMGGLFSASDSVNREEFGRFAAPWLSAVPTIEAIGWSQRLRPHDLQAYEARIRDARLPGGAVFERLPDGSVAPLAPAAEYFPVTYVAPSASNAAELGLNLLGSVAAREAIQRARQAGTPQASAPVQLGQLTANEIGIVVHHVLLDPVAPANAAPDETTLGAVFVSLRLSDIFERLPVVGNGMIDLCLLDKSGGQAIRLAGAPGCERASAPGPLSQAIDRDFGGRQWQLRIVAQTAYIRAQRDWGSWGLAVLGLLGASILGVFLLGQFDRQRRFEIEVAARTRQLAHEIREREAAELASRAKSEFLSRMSHELRTPLNAVLGFAQLLEADRNAPLSAHQLERVKLIEKAGWHLRDMIDEVLDLARIEAGAVSLDTERVDVSRLLEECRALLAADAARHPVTIGPVSIDPTLPDATVLGDSTRVRQILLNLLGNAIKYNREGGSVELRIAPSGGNEIAVSVTDTGPGLSADEIPRLFVPFDRIGQEKTSPGTGIGLAISKHLAERMAGRLAVTSEPGRGSTFTLVLPAAQREPATRQTASAEPEAWTGATGAATQAPAGAPAAAAGHESRRTTQEAAGLPPGTPLRYAVCIEDNALNAEVIRETLGRIGEFALSTCARADAGLATARALKPALVVLDLNLPDRHGLEVLEELKRDPATAAIPVVVVSADVTPSTRRRALEAGAAGFLEKPLDLATFAERISTLLSEPAG